MNVICGFIATLFCYLIISIPNASYIIILISVLLLYSVCNFSILLCPPPTVLERALGRGEGWWWHSARTIAHCHKCLDFTPENQKTSVCREKKVLVTYGGALKLISLLGLVSRDVRLCHSVRPRRSATYVFVITSVCIGSSLTPFTVHR